MQEAINLIQSFSKSEYRKLKAKLLNYEPILRKQALNADQALIELDPFKHSLGYCFFLYVFIVNFIFFFFLK